MSVLFSGPMGNDTQSSASRQNESPKSYAKKTPVDYLYPASSFRLNWIGQLQYYYAVFSQIECRGKFHSIWKKEAKIEKPFI